MSNWFLLLQIPELDHLKQFRDPQARWGTCVCSCGKQCCGTFPGIQLPKGQLGCPTELVSGPLAIQWHFWYRVEGLQCCNVHTKCHENQSLGSEVEGVRRTQTAWWYNKPTFCWRQESRLKDCVCTVGVSKSLQILISYWD